MPERAVLESQPVDRPAAAMVVGGVVALEGGAAIARTLFATAGVPGTVALRLGFGSLLLGLRRRPALPRGRRQVVVTVGVGLLLVAHHLAFYAAIDRLPLGVAVTIEFCGPLALALAGSRRPGHLACAALAAGGVVLASGFGLGGHWSLLGVACSLAAGGCWAGYITLFPRVDASGDRGRALSTVTLIAALVSLPYGIAVDHAGVFTVRSLGLGLLMAAVADFTAYTLQAHALSRLSGRVFSVLTSTDPAVAALVGLLALGQHIDGSEWAGILMVTVAAAVTSLQR